MGKLRAFFVKLSCFCKGVVLPYYVARAAPALLIGERGVFMASRNLTRDMSYGRPIGHILAFSLPLIFGNLFQQMYSMVDTIIVGQYLGVDALAAVGSVGSLQFLIIGFCTGS